MRRGIALVLTVVLLVFGVSVAAETITLPHELPAYNQAYSNGRGAWGDCLLGTGGCPDTVFESGCLVTAFASVLAYYEISVDVPASASWTGMARRGMDPGLLNDWLKLRGAFGKCPEDPLGSCCLDWSRLPSAVSLTSHVNRSEIGVNSVSAVVIDHALRQGTPVIAGIHYGASCNGSATQSENCHWVVLTGKIGDIYTIMDPYNPDASDPHGVRTTLDKGSKGAYVIDRFVVVEGPTAPSAALVASFGAANAPGFVQERSLQLFGWSDPVLVYARVVTPDGQARFAHYDTNTPSLGDDPLWSANPTTLVPSPRDLSLPWVWNRTTLEEQDIGAWAWSLWVEDPAQPGVRIAETSIRYEVREPSTGEGTTSLLALLLVVAIITGIIFAVSTDALP